MTSQQQDAGAEQQLLSPAARRFVGALRAVEDRGDLDDMVALTTDSTRWWSTGIDRTDAGQDGARRFWNAYRRSFAEITSEFTQVTETTARVVLEWTSHGRHHSGRPVRYAGATVLELGDEPTEDQTLAAVRLYFDTAAAVVPEDRTGSENTTGDDARDDGSMLDRETTASGRNSGLAPGRDDASQ